MLVPRYAEGGQARLVASSAKRAPFHGGARSENG